jgi:hypothetical protein
VSERQRIATLEAKSRTSAAVLAAPEAASMRRLAWAFACAKKDSDEEIALFRVLIAQVHRRYDADGKRKAQDGGGS